MQRTNLKLNEAEQRLVRSWTATVIAFYGAIFFVFITLVVANITVGERVASAIHQEVQKAELVLDHATQAKR